MSEAPPAAQPLWEQAVLAAALFALEPPLLGGVAIKALPGPVRERWLALLRQWLPKQVPLRRIPLHVSDSRLLGGLDLAATLRAGRPVAERGLLAESHGGVVLLPMAERVSAGTAARLAAVLDTGELAAERDGFALRAPARLGVVLLDESLSEEERAPPALMDRLAFHLDLTPLSHRDATEPLFGLDEVREARARLPGVTGEAGALEALCATAAGLGIGSVRAPLLALKAARAAAALAGREQVAEDDLTLAARLVLAPRAEVLPAASTAEEGEQDETPPTPPEAPPPPEQPPPEQADAGQQPEAAPPAPEQSEDSAPEPPAEAALEERVLEAARAAVPPGLLAQLIKAGGQLMRGGAAGKAGQLRQGLLRGRPAGVRSGQPGGGARLNVIETLRAAAPWQRLRGPGTQPAAASGRPRPAGVRVQVRSEDFRVTRYKARSQTTTLFLVDASGSSALHRLAEAKGAVELLLADCYVRRDRVALVAFRGQSADLLLPPTRSLVRAKRALAGLPGGGGTPLAAGLEAAGALAEALRREGDSVVLVLLTDGRANIARDGSPGRARAAEDAACAARMLRATGLAALLVDTSPRPQDSARALAAELGARYLPLPYADAQSLGQAVRTAGAA